MENLLESRLISETLETKDYNLEKMKQSKKTIRTCTKSITGENGNSEGDSSTTRETTEPEYTILRN